MRLMPFVFAAIGVVGSYYFKFLTQKQKTWIKFAIGILLIVGWAYLLVEVI